MKLDKEGKYSELMKTFINLIVYLTIYFALVSALELFFSRHIEGEVPLYAVLIISITSMITAIKTHTHITKQ